MENSKRKQCEITQPSPHCHWWAYIFGICASSKKEIFDNIFPNCLAESSADEKKREKSSININMNLKTWATTGELGCSSLKYSPPTRHWGCHQGLGHFPSDTATHRHLCSLASAKSSFALCFHVVFEGGLSKQIWETTWLAGDSKWEAVSKTERGFYPSEI